MYRSSVEVFISEEDRALKKSTAEWKAHVCEALRASLVDLCAKPASEASMHAVSAVLADAAEMPALCEILDLTLSDNETEHHSILQPLPLLRLARHWHPVYLPSSMAFT